MAKKDTIEDTTQLLRQSVIDTKDFKQKQKHCIRDYSGAVFELTSDMLVKNNNTSDEENLEINGVAECILRKYEKLLSVK